MNNKRTVFFWLGIVSAVLLLAYVGYGISAYNTQVNYYVEYYQGVYTADQVRELIPFYSSYLSDKGTDTILLLILTALLFIGDALVKNLKDFLGMFMLAVFDDCGCDEDCDCGCEECTEETAEQEEEPEPEVPAEAAETKDEETKTEE